MRCFNGCFIRRSVRSSLLSVALALPLSGCGGLVDLGQNGPPPSIFTLEPLPRADKDDQRAPLIFVEEPQLSGALDTTRIAVRRGANRFEYLAVARWEERTSRLLQRYVARSLDNRAGLEAVGDFNIDLPVGYRLRLDVRNFEAQTDADRADGLTVRVNWVAMIIEATSSKIIGQRNLVADRQAASDSPSDVIAAYNAATDMAVKDLAIWLGEVLGRQDDAQNAALDRS
ncbi:ABC-type transport auxiliary lipoprotein family protein [Iodidimonas gelatinilytica]|nr:ABC-type transport auxiliary lipoprotein family protein [Iodidimonas gelatinilytica]